VKHPISDAGEKLFRSRKAARRGVLGPVYRRSTIAGLVVLAFVAGCTPWNPTPSNAPQIATAPQVPTVPVADVQSPLTTQPLQVEPVQESAPMVEAPSSKALTPAATKTTGARVAVVATPKIEVAAKPAALSTNAAAIANVSKPVIVPKQSPPTLDLASLEQRLRDTRAIGVMTKLSLKNQVDDLLDEFRAFYQGKVKTPLTLLRQRYDLLMMKVLTLLQDKDTALAANILASREAIWGMLNDPKRLSQIG
jgi:hypothetical protein